MIGLANILSQHVIKHFEGMNPGETFIIERDKAGTFIVTSVDEDGHKLTTEGDSATAALFGAEMGE